ncbi:MAG: hypothetical protein GXP16_11750 [Gammaproteobacteria bacterium]|nr:hypothetical protein [Gammaproteobacteria bacterium]
MQAVGTYLLSIITEGFVIALLFWIITYITIESTSLAGTFRAGLIGEAVGNVVYLFDLPATSPPGILMAMVGAYVFIHQVLRIGELTPMKAFYGVAMTYFALIALFTCNS